MADKGTWKIVIGTETLADYADIVARAPISGGPIIHNEPLVGSANRFRASRANWEIRRDFVIVKEHANNKVSADWYETCVQTFAGLYDVWITHKDHSNVETTYKIASAEVQIETDEPIGVTTVSRVSVLGGQATEFV